MGQHVASWGTAVRKPGATKEEKQRAGGVIGEGKSTKEASQWEGRRRGEQE